MNMLPVTPRALTASILRTRSSPRCILSGDFVDYFRVDERRIGFYLADVSGHGASSAFVTVLLKFMTTRLLYESRRGGTLREFKPSEVLDHINRGLINCKLGKHVTMLGGVIDQSVTCCTTASVVICRCRCSIRARAPTTEGRGLPVGLFVEATYQDFELKLPETFSLTLLSDGILDLLPGETLKEKESALPGLISDAGGTLDGLRRVFGLAELADMPDDIALLVLSRNLA